jgi:hypothetical protein
VLVKQKRENTNKQKTKKNKLWLKAQIAKNQSKESHNGNKKNKDSHACLKTKIYLFFIFCRLLTEKKQAKGKMT